MTSKISFDKIYLAFLRATYRENKLLMRFLRVMQDPKSRAVELNFLSDVASTIRQDGEDL